MPYRIVWRYTVKPEHARAFEAAYGPHGEWARFFRSGEGYLGTELVSVEPGRIYMTIDTWQTGQQYERFADERAAEYAAIDAGFEPWTEHEEKIGAGETL